MFWQLSVLFRHVWEMRTPVTAWYIFRPSPEVTNTFSKLLDCNNYLEVRGNRNLFVLKWTYMINRPRDIKGNLLPSTNNRFPSTFIFSLSKLCLCGLMFLSAYVSQLHICHFTVFFHGWVCFTCNTGQISSPWKKSQTQTSLSVFYLNHFVWIVEDRSQLL